LKLDRFFEKNVGAKIFIERKKGEMEKEIENTNRKNDFQGYIENFLKKKFPKIPER